MRTSVNVSDDLLHQVMRESRAKTITQAIREALMAYLDLRRRKRLVQSFGSFENWNPDIRKMRRSRDLG
ncbi:MAG: type II toxin-antitoxin system VapB family antitoxin [Deltaproteobacteria bacterium]|nr:type II toxin-antitoxin system VapB family antitoxin [Deltaproteobacteria bacterium]